MKIADITLQLISPLSCFSQKTELSVPLLFLFFIFHHGLSHLTIFSSLCLRYREVVGRGVPHGGCLRWAITLHELPVDHGRWWRPSCFACLLRLKDEHEPKYHAGFWSIRLARRKAELVVACWAVRKLGEKKVDGNLFIREIRSTSVYSNFFSSSLFVWFVVYDATCFFDEKKEFPKHGYVHLFWDAESI